MKYTVNLSNTQKSWDYIRHSYNTGKNRNVDFILFSAIGTTRVLAVIKMPGKIADKITKLGEFVLLCTNNPNISFPAAFLDPINTRLGELQTAQTLALTKAVGSASARNIKLANSMNDLYTIQSAVQLKANTLGGEAAINLVLSTGFKVKQTGVRVKADFLVRNVKNKSGSLELISKAVAKRASYDWQWSFNGASWTDLETTLQANTTITGQTAGTKLFFRKRGITKDGALEWSQTFVIIVA